MSDCYQSLKSGAPAALGLACGSPRVAVNRLQAETGDTDAATARTVRKMLEHIAAGVSDPEVKRCAAESQVYLPADASLYARAWCWWWWVRTHVRFVSDHEAIAQLLDEADQLELLISPPVLVRMVNPEGDCDDFTMLVCAGLLALGVPCQIITVASNPAGPDEFSHVYARAEVAPGRFVNMDASHGERPGWEVPPDRQYRRAIWTMDGKQTEVSTMARFNGLHGYHDAVRVSPESVARLNMGAQSGLLLPAGSPMPMGRVHLRPARGMGDAVTGDTAAAPSSWGDVFRSLAVTGGDILRQQLAPLNPGEYVQTASGVRSRDVPGAVPGQYPGTGFNVSTSGGSWLPWVLAGGVGLVLIMGMNKRGR